MTDLPTNIARDNLLREINYLAHSPGVDAWIRDRLQHLHRSVRKMEGELLAECAQAIRLCPSLDENGYICEKSAALKALRDPGQ